MSYLKHHNLCVVPSDNEGGFGVFSHGLFFEKAMTAIGDVMFPRSDVSPEAVKAKARKLCEQMNLSGLSKQIEKCTKLGLDMFFFCGEDT